MIFKRYAIYITPDPEALSDFGAAWLGWNCDTGQTQAHPVLAGLPLSVDELTRTPRRYGLHGTVKAPFQLKAGQSPRLLDAALQNHCDRESPVEIAGLRLSDTGRFLALIPDGDDTDLNALAARTVTGLDTFRAPPDAAELTRRRKTPLTPAQDGNLTRWGYPYVLDDYRFHMTLSGSFDTETLARTRSALSPHLSPLLPRPFRIDALTLAGEASDGMFRTIERYPLGG